MWRFPNEIGSTIIKLVFCGKFEEWLVFRFYYMCDTDSESFKNVVTVNIIEPLCWHWFGAPTVQGTD